MKLLKELRDELLHIESTPKKLREFGLVVGGVLLALAGLLAWRGKPYHVFIITGAPLVMLGLFLPRTLKPLQKVWMGLALILGAFMSRLILALVFYLGLVPIHVIARLTGKKFIDLEFRKPQDSYWIHRPEEPFNRERSEKQF